MDRLNLNDLVISGLFGNFLVLYVFLIPVLTMRSFAEERKQGTDELLLTAPVSPGLLVAGKYLGQLAITGVLVGAAAFYVAVLLRYGDPEKGPIVTGLIGLSLVVAAPDGDRFRGVDRHQESSRRGRLLVRPVPPPLRRRLARGVDRGRPAGGAQGAVAPRALRGLRQGHRLLRRRRVLRFVGGPGLFGARAAIASQRFR